MTFLIKTSFDILTKSSLELEGTVLKEFILEAKNKREAIEKMFKAVDDYTNEHFPETFAGVNCFDIYRRMA